MRKASTTSVKLFNLFVLELENIFNSKMELQFDMAIGNGKKFLAGKMRLPVPS